MQPVVPPDRKTELDRATALVYHQLKALARHYLASERREHSLQPTALVHEAYMRLSGQREADFSNRAQFVALAAQMMRRVLLDYAKARQRLKRGSAPERIELESTVAISPAQTVDLIDLDRAMNRLGEMDERLVHVVEMRYFGGLSIEEIAAVLGVGVATVSRDWSAARLFLTKELTS